MRYVVEQSHWVYCPQCVNPFWSRKGVWFSKTFTCPICGVEVLR